MRKSRFTEEQIAYALRHVEAGTPAAQLCRNTGISEQPFCLWSTNRQRFLAQFGDRIILHFLPPYCPDDNRIERVWLDQHANVTRDHRRSSMEELMVQVVAFLRAYKQWKMLYHWPKLAACVSGSRSVVWSGLA